jgi:hypothetical protein
MLKIDGAAIVHVVAGGDGRHHIKLMAYRNHMVKPKEKFSIVDKESHRTLLTNSEVRDPRIKTYNPE